MATFTPQTSAELATAITNAAAGDEILLDKNILYSGNFVLANKTGVVTIRTLDMSWSSAGLRARPSDTQFMAKVKGILASPIFHCPPGSNNWKLLGLEIIASSTVHTISAVAFGDLTTATSLSQLPDNVTVERCYIHGDSVLGGRRGVFIMGTNHTVKDCWIDTFFHSGTDTQAILVAEGHGPTLIENNYLEGAAENLFIVSVSPLISGEFPTNITVRRNHIKKRLAWQSGTGYVLKNLLEVKSGRSLLIEGNVFENNWTISQNGYAVLFSMRDENGDGAAEISDVIFRNNKIINSDNGIAASGKDDSAGNVGSLFNVTIDNNYIEDNVNKAFSFRNGITSIVLTNNSALGVSGTNSAIWNSSQLVSGSITFDNNAVGYGEYGIKHDGTLDGDASVAAFWTSADIADNYSFPPPPFGQPYTGFTFVADASLIPAGVGVNFTTLNAAIANVVNAWGTPNPPPPLPPTPPAPPPPPITPTPALGTDIVAKASSNLNDFGYFYKAEDFNDSIQDAYDEIVSLTGCYPKAVAISAIANKTYYDMPLLITDFVALRGIYNRRIKRWLIPKSMRWLDAQRDDWELQSGEPEYFVPVNYRYVAIYPRVSVTSGSFWVFYYAAADTLVGGSIPNLPSVSGDLAIENYVTADLFEQAEEWVKAQEYYSEYLKALREVEKFRNTLRLPDYVDGLR